MKGNRSKPSASYAGSHAQKVKSTATTSAAGGEAGGKMTKFKSLDEIPDSQPDYDWSNDGNTYEDNYDDDYDNKQSGFQHQSSDKNVPRSPPSTNKPGSISAQSYNAPMQPVVVGRKAETNQPKGHISKIPPLPYDQTKSANKPSLPVSNQIPAPPNSKYFDYDNGDDNFDDDEVYSPNSKAFAIKKVNYSSIGGAGGAAPRSPEFVPPLPCESKASGDKGAAAEQDSIYFSKKPRPVNFK